MVHCDSVLSQLILGSAALASSRAVAAAVGRAESRPCAPVLHHKIVKGFWIGPSSWTQIGVPYIVHISPLRKATLPLYPPVGSMVGL